MRIRHTDHEEKVELQMVPMIDIVFQMLVFFIMTFKIVLPEGDFNIRMPSTAAARAVEPSELPPLTLVIKADAGGELADVQLSGRSFGNGPDVFAGLHQYIRGLVEAGGDAAAQQEIELDCDYNLNYAYVMRAITAVTGYIENGRRHKLIERIKFTPPERG